LPTIIETTDALATSATSYNLVVDGFFKGTLANAVDLDWVAINLVAGQVYSFAMVGTGVLEQSVNNTFLSLYNSVGGLLSSDATSGPGNYSDIEFIAASTGTYYLEASNGPGVDVGSYMISATLGTKASYDIEMGAAVLYRDDNSWSDTAATPATVSWAVRDSNPGATDASGDATAFIQMNGPQTTAAEQVLAQISEFCGLTFNRVNPTGTSNDASILFSAYNSTTDGAGAYVSSRFDGNGNFQGVDLNLNLDSVSTTSLPLGSYSFGTMLHEVGHTLGLAHPGDYNAGPGVNITFENSAQFKQDGSRVSIMSYFDDFAYNPNTMMLADIYALQQLYGVNTTTRTGNTVYGFNSTAGDAYNLSLNTPAAFCIWDSNGIDTLDGSLNTFSVANANYSQIIDLLAGAFSDIAGQFGNISIALGAVIENAIGGQFEDKIYGNAAGNTLNGGAGVDELYGFSGNDILIGGLGADILDGGDNIDTADYSEKTTAVVVVLNQANQMVVTVGGVAEDSIKNIENIVGGSAGDTLNGDGLANALFGGAGADTLNGRGGADRMDGGTGADTFIVENLGDVIVEATGGGDDRVVADVTYVLNTLAEVETLSTRQHNTVNAIDLTGNEFAQTLQGNFGANILDGRGGADRMFGFNGADIYVVDNAGDMIFENVGGGNDRVVADVNYVLTGYAEVETLTTRQHNTVNAINLTGNEFGQTLQGNFGVNTLDGRGGADRLEGYAGADLYIVDNVGDVVVEDVGGGTDRVVADVSYVLSAGAEVETLSSRQHSLVVSINLTGNEFGQTLQGTFGVNILNGKGGNDVLFGFNGADTFVFDTALGAGNIDQLADFSVVDDTINVDDAIFAGLATGALAASAFVLGSAGTLANTAQILYNAGTGAISYDRDGSSGGFASQQFATVGTGLGLTAADFFVF
jgi:serralysin